MGRLTAFAAILSLLIPAGSVFAGAGDLDPNFGDQGKVLTNFTGATNDKVQAMVLQPDGKALAMVTMEGGGIPECTIVRLNPDGTSDDTSFQTIQDFYASDITIQADGKILLAGSFRTATYDIGVIRYNTDGALDVNFGTAGIVSADFGQDEQAKALAVQSDGKIVVASEISSSTDHIGIARFNSDGSIDTTFGTGGLVVTDVQNGNDYATDIAVQSDGNILLSGYSSLIGSYSDFLVARYTPAGILDTSFNSTGYALTDFYAGPDYASAMTLQQDGKLILAGQASSTITSDYGVARYNPDGSLDSTFGTGGKAVIQTTWSYDWAYAVAIQNTGRILLFGFSGMAGGRPSLSMARLNPDGSPDSTFGTGGLLNITIADYGVSSQTGISLPDDRIMTGGGIWSTMPDPDGQLGDSDILVTRILNDGAFDTTFGVNGIYRNGFGGPVHDSIRSLLMQRDGQVIAVGSSPSSYFESTLIPRFALIRYRSDGSIDPDYGLNGQSIAENTGEAHAAAMQPDGKAIVAGSSYPFAHFLLARFLADGSVDTSFGINGIVTNQDFAGTANAIAIQQDGKILLGGESGPYPSRFTVVRYNADGTLDEAFGSGGVVFTDFPNESVIESLAIQSNGRIIAGGRVGLSHFDFALARYTSDGSLDTTFGSGGTVVTELYGNDTEIHAIALQTDGRIVAAGSTFNSLSSTHDFALARYMADGSLDTTFGSAGWVITTFEPLADDEATAVAIQPDGRILAGGSTGQAYATHFALARYNSDGSLDGSFSSDGLAVADFGGFYGDKVNALLIGADGNIWAGGDSWQRSTGLDFALARFLGHDYLLYDDFEDGLLTWTVKKGAWAEQAGVLTVPADKSIIFAPAAWDPSGESGCSNCTITFDVQTPAGPYSKVFLEGWYQNGANRVELIMNADRGKWILKQRVGAAVVVSGKVSRQILPNVAYRVEVAFDGTYFRLTIDGEQVLTLRAAAAPSGNLGFKVKNTGLTVNQVSVY